MLQQHRNRLPDSNHKITEISPIESNQVASTPQDITPMAQ